MTSITATAVYSSWSEDVVDASWCEAATAPNVLRSAVNASVATSTVDMGASPTNRGRIMRTAPAIGCRRTVAALRRIVRVAMLAARAITATRPISGRLTVYAEAHECGGCGLNNWRVIGSSLNSDAYWSISSEQFGHQCHWVHIDNQHRNRVIRSRHICSRKCLAIG